MADVNNVIYLVGDAHISRQLVQNESPETSNRFSEDRSLTERSYLAGVYHMETILHACQAAAGGVHSSYYIDGPLLRLKSEYSKIVQSMPTNAYLCRELEVQIGDGDERRLFVTEDLGLTPPPGGAPFPVSGIKSIDAPFNEDADAEKVIEVVPVMEAPHLQGGKVSVIILQINFYGFFEHEIDHVEPIKQILERNPEAVLVIRINDRSGGSKIRSAQSASARFHKVNENLYSLLSDHSIGERTVLEISANDLRQEGLFISQSVSWARTTHTMVNELHAQLQKVAQRSSARSTLDLLHLVRTTVVTFGPDGAIVYTKAPTRDLNEDLSEDRELQLVFQADMVEDELYERIPGRMRGVDSCVTAGIAHHLAIRGIASKSWSTEDLVHGVVLGLKAARVIHFHTYDKVEIEGTGGRAHNRRDFDSALLRLTCNPPTSGGEKLSAQNQLEAVIVKAAQQDTLARSNGVSARLKAVLDEQVKYHYASPPLAAGDNQQYLVPTVLWCFPFDLVAGIVVNRSPHNHIKFAGVTGTLDSIKDVIKKNKLLIDEWEAAGWLSVHNAHKFIFWRISRGVRFSYMESTALRFSGTANAVAIQSKLLSVQEHERNELIAKLVEEFIKCLSLRLLIDGPEWAFDSDSKIANEREKFMGGPNAPDYTGVGLTNLFQVNPCARVGGKQPKKNDYYVLDRKEAENFRVLKDIIRENFPQSGPRHQRPVSIGVFGPPGSGKSFTIKQLLGLFKTGGRDFKPLTFNLSQFSGEEDLGAAFDLIQDSYLEGNLPAVFWDEYDTTVGSTKLFWLSKFIGPMWDGDYLRRSRARKLPPCLFVFAGSMMHTFAQMASLDALDHLAAAWEGLSGPQRQSLDESVIVRVDDIEKLEREREALRLLRELRADPSQEFTLVREAIEQFGVEANEGKLSVPDDLAVGSVTYGEWVAAKGKDFKSRLVGRLDVLSPNDDPLPTSFSQFASQRPETGAHYLRRAAILRSVLWKQFKNSGLFTKNKLHISEAVAKAFIETPRYYHGARSIEQLVGAMNMEGQTFISDLNLPPDVDMNCHVDGRNFSTLAGGGSVPS